MKDDDITTIIMTVLILLTMVASIVAYTNPFNIYGTTKIEEGLNGSS